MRAARKPGLLALTLLVAAGIAGCGGGYDGSVSYTGDPKPSDVPHAIPDVLEKDKDQRFTTLLSLVDAAGLGEALAGTGPLTLFAPTNDAFSRKFSPAQLQALSQNVEALEDTLRLHVSTEDVTFAKPPYVTEVSGERGPELRVDGRLPLDKAGLRIVDDRAAAVPTLEGSTIVVKPTRTVAGPDGLDVPVVEHDWQAPNGFIQVIGGVLGSPARP